MTWNARLRVIGLAAALLMALWAAAQAQERAALSLAEAGSDRLGVAWTWLGDEPNAFTVHWRQRVSGAEWASAEIAGSARRYAITGLRPFSAYIVRVRPLDAEGNRIRALNGRSLDLRGVFDTIQLPVPDPPRVVFDGERATAAWDAVEGATGYELAWGLAGGEAATERLGADALEFTTGALAAGSRYEFRLRSLHQRDRSAPSAAATLTPAAWPHAAPRARFEFHRAAGMLVEWDAVTGAEDYVVAWQKESDASRGGGDGGDGDQRAGDARGRLLHPAPGCSASAPRRPERGRRARASGSTRPRRNCASRSNPPATSAPKAPSPRSAGAAAAAQATSGPTSTGGRSARASTRSRSTAASSPAPQTAKSTNPSATPSSPASSSTAAAPSSPPQSACRAPKPCRHRLLITNGTRQILFGSGGSAPQFMTIQPRRSSRSGTCFQEIFNGHIRQ